MAALAGRDPCKREARDAGCSDDVRDQLLAARQHLDKAISRPLDHLPRADTARFEFNLRLVALGTMIQVLWLQGFPDQAIAAARRQLKEAEASHYAWAYSHAVQQSATMAMHARDYAAGQRYAEIGEAHSIKHGLTFWWSSYQDRWKLYMGLPVNLDETRATLASLRERGMRIYYPHFLTNYGEALARQEDYRSGLAAIDEAIALCEQTGQVMVIPEILRIKGNVIRFQDPQGSGRAADCYRQAVHMARGSGALSWEIRAATSLVKLLRACGADDTEAEGMLAAVYSRFTEGFGTGDLVGARSLLDPRPSHPGAIR